MLKGLRVSLSQRGAGLCIQGDTQVSGLEGKGAGERREGGWV